MRPVVLRGGISVDWDVVTVLMAIEQAGGRFVVTDGRITVLPPGVLTAVDRAFLIAHKPEVLRILAYQADPADALVPSTGGSE
jgi:hypothetical protein